MQNAKDSSYASFRSIIESSENTPRYKVFSKDRISTRRFKMDFPQKGNYWFPEPGRRRRRREQQAGGVESKKKRKT